MRLGRIDNLFVACYMSAALLDEGGSEYSFIELKLPVQAVSPKWKKEQEETNSRTTDDDVEEN